MFVYCLFPACSTVVLHRGVLAPRAHWHCLETFLGGVGAIYWVEAKDATKHPILHRTALTTKNYLDQTVNSLGNPALEWKPCENGDFFFCLINIYHMNECIDECVSGANVSKDKEGRGSRSCEDRADGNNSQGKNTKLKFVLHHQSTNPKDS